DHRCTDEGGAGACRHRPEDTGRQSRHLGADRAAHGGERRCRARHGGHADEGDRRAERTRRRADRCRPAERRRRSGCQAAEIAGGQPSMDATLTRRTEPERASFAELFTPKLITVLREGYGRKQIQADLIAGLTVAIVALPLSMAIAIASHVDPARGLFTAIVGGFLVGALGGSRFQIGGPAGAFIVLVAATVDRHGIDGMLLATLMAGAILVA